MKRVLLICLAFVITAVTLSGCSGGEAAKTTTLAETTTTTATTQTTTETTTQAASTDPLDYMYTGMEAKVIVKEYFEKHGYSFDDWNVISDSAESFQASNPSGSGYGIVARKDYLMFDTGTGNAVIMNLDRSGDPSLSVQVQDSSLDAYEMLSMLFEKCPEDLKPPVDEIREKTKAAGGKYFDIEKDGLYYRSMEIPSGGLTMTGFDTKAPGGWNE